MSLKVENLNDNTAWTWGRRSPWDTQWVRFYGIKRGSVWSFYPAPRLVRTAALNNDIVAASYVDPTVEPRVWFPVETCQPQDLQLKTEMTLVISLHSGDPNVIYLAWANTQTSKCLFSIFRVEWNASAIRAIRPTGAAGRWNINGSHRIKIKWYCNWI